MSREGYARLRIEVVEPESVLVKVLFVEPVEETPEAYRKRWEEEVKRWEERGEEWEEGMPCWLEYSARVRGTVELSLPKGIYLFEASRRGFESMVAHVYLLDDVEVPVLLFKGRGATYYGKIRPKREVPPVRLQFRVLVDGKPAKGAVARFYLAAAWEDIEDEVKEEGFVWEECGIQSKEDGTVELELLTGIHEASVSLEGYRTATFRLLIARDTELSLINLERGEGGVDLGLVLPEYVEDAGAVKRTPLTRTKARLRFKVLAEGEPTGDAFAYFSLVVPLFEVLRCLRDVVKKREGLYMLFEWKAKAGEDGLIEKKLPPGLYGVRVSMRGCRDVVFGVCLTEDMELPPIELKTGEGKPNYLGAFIPANITR